MTRGGSFWRQALVPRGDPGSRDLAVRATQLQRLVHGVFLKDGRRAPVVLRLIRVAAQVLEGRRGVIEGWYAGCECSFLACSWCLGGHPNAVLRRPTKGTPIVAGSWQVPASSAVAASSPSDHLGWSPSHLVMWRAPSTSNAVARL